MEKVSILSTGISELDDVIRGVRAGDNVVWQLDAIDDYIRYVHAFCRYANRANIQLIYFRFADHREVIGDDINAEVYHLKPEYGFEIFIGEILRVIETTGKGAFYVFDSLSELAVDWNSDRMLGNFFMLTCPYLYEYDTVAFFALLRNRHSVYTTNAILDTAQVVINHYTKNGEIYIHPLKVDGRHSTTMYMLHKWKEGRYYPIKNSWTISEILGNEPHPGLDLSDTQQDLWKRIFSRAKEIQKEIEGGRPRDEEYDKFKNRLLHMAVTRDEQLFELAREYMDLSDVINIGNHMAGTGLIGGKSVGMLIAQSILEKNEYLKKKLETHDSFFIGSDVFYTYLIKSRCWWIRWKQKNSRDFEGSEEARNRLLSGSFPEDIQDQFREILNYFGQSPIIVRSSSLLEDAYGNSFSGKYESVFCGNQGTPDERLREFTNAVKKVYASTMNLEALTYRDKRNLLGRDEQMALLVQRVSGAMYGKYYLPQIAGVGFSYNLYVWHKSIDPKAGVLRLVFGLGTRAVNRSDDDYTRIVAVNEPLKKPEADYKGIRKYAQRKVDLLNLESNRFSSEYFTDIFPEISAIPLDLFASPDMEMELSMMRMNPENRRNLILTFDRLFSETDVVSDLGKILKTLENVYEHPVDIEFTVNFSDDLNYKINLLQCRPYQIKRAAGIVKDPGHIAQENLILKTHGPIIGTSKHLPVDVIIFVVPSVYGSLSERNKYAVAELVGRIMKAPGMKTKAIMLLGPGRWGTTTPSLGVPIQFADIRNVSVLCEIAEMHDGLVPDVSLGTHFFNDLIEFDILYLAVYPDKPDTIINRQFLNEAKNGLADLFPGDEKWLNTVKVIDFSDTGNGAQAYINVNSIDQKGLLYVVKKQPGN